MVFWNAAARRMTAAASFCTSQRRGEEALVQWEETCARLEEEMLQGFDRSEQDQFYDFLLRAYDKSETNEERG